MAEQPKQEKKGVWFKLQEAVPDREEQFEFVSLLVRLILLGWATAMLSLSYLDLSKLGIPQQKIDPTFIASVFVGLASSFGASITQKGKDNGSKQQGKSVKSELQELLGTTQLVRIDTPIKLIVDPESSKK
jgi:hypothetical protein|tara:strand:+ start:255 stop:647 length:393 start_codon:yes stop_codon:yes gene_type:complete